TAKKSASKNTASSQVKSNTLKTRVVKARVQKRVSKKPKRPSLLKRLTDHPLRNHPFVVPVVTFVMLSFFSMGVFVLGNATTLGPSDTKVVHLQVDQDNQTIPTRAKNIKELLEKL